MVSRVRTMMGSRTTAYLLIVGGACLAAGAAVLWTYQRHTAPLPPAGAVAQAAGQAQRPSLQAVASYHVAPDRPKYLRIPAIGVPQTRIIPLGIMADHQIATPDNIYDIGWYIGSAKPGQPGATFLFGHISNWVADGVFYNLKKLKPGDRVLLTRGDDKLLTYQVASFKTYPADRVDMHAVLTPVDPAKPGLNLMTCAGSIAPGTSAFSERLVVFTEQVSA